MTGIYGMAVLLIRFLFVWVSYYILEKIDWRKVFHDRYYYLAQYLCLLLSIVVGHLAGSFILTIIESMQAILLSRL